MIVGAHIVIASADPERDHSFFRDVLELRSVDAGGGYLIFKLPEGEASIHESPGPIPHHELYFLVDDVNALCEKLKAQNVECTEINDTGWGLVTTITLPSGAPLSVYQPRHERP